ncbi:MAG: lanthionine synthetase C family protein [Bacteroidetes bacterium]|nr:lanthionine synthetase C family protein [Bacteroidota bacterium]
MLHEKIRAIAHSVYEDRDTAVKVSGLLSGDAGVALFFAYLAIAYPESPYEEITLEYLEKLSDALAHQQLPHYLSSGVAGIGFVFQHLRNIGLLDGSEDIGLDVLDESIMNGAEQDFSVGNWDPLHGLVGLGIYFLERYKETGESKYLERIVDQLSALAVDEDSGKVWVTPGYRHYSVDNYNFGMAHGMPGLLSFLAEVYTLGIRRNVIGDLVTSCCTFLLDHYQIDGEHYGFPASIQLKPEPTPLPSRNGWCYGDLGVAIALIHCGRALTRGDWVLLGTEIALKTTQIPFEAAGCGDASFCHGAVGLVHQYYRLFRSTRDIRFKDAADRWLSFMQEKYYRPDAYPGGYAHRKYDESTGSYSDVPSYGLLEGITGIGLVFLSCDAGVLPDWDIIFQTNV